MNQKATSTSLHLVTKGASSSGPQPIAQDNDQLILRAQAAKILKISMPTVRRLEKNVLPPVRIDERGVHWHSLRAVQEYAAQLMKPIAADDCIDGAIAAEAFELLDDGADAADLVKALRIVPTVASKLQVQWADLRGAMVISGRTLSKIRGFRTTDDNPILTGDELLRFLDDNELPQCKVCRRAPSFCMGCYKNRPRRAEAILAVAIREADEREAELRTQQLDRETYALARKRAAYVPSVSPLGSPICDARKHEVKTCIDARPPQHSSLDGKKISPSTDGDQLDTSSVEHVKSPITCTEPASELEAFLKDAIAAESQMLAKLAAMTSPAEQERAVAGDTVDRINQPNIDERPSPK